MTYRYIISRNLLHMTVNMSSTKANQTYFLSLNSKRHKLLNSLAWQSDPGPTKWLNDHVVIIGHSPFFLLDKFPHSALSASGTFPYHIHSCTSALLWSV